MTHSTRLVVFDVGGVVVRTGRTWAEDAGLAGFHFDDAWLQRFEDRREALPSLTRGEITSHDYCELMASMSDGVLTPEDVRRITAASLIEEYPRVGSVFDALEVTGVETALLMNLNEIEWARYFPEGGRSDVFPTVSRARYRFGSHLIGAAKPSRHIYEHVESNTGYSGREILFFDDRPENVAGAQKLGWMAELIDHEGDTASQVLASLSQYGVI